MKEIRGCLWCDNKFHPKHNNQQICSDPKCIAKEAEYQENKSDYDD